MNQQVTDPNGSPEARERTRLRWLCRRGTRELDLLLTRYLDQAWDDASASERAAFARLLDYQDPELYSLLTGRAVDDDAGLAAVVRRIRGLAGL